LLLALVILLAAATIWILQLLPFRVGSILEPALPLVEPVTRDIAAGLGWQKTKILLESGQTYRVQFVAGEIRDGESIFRGPAGSGYVCGDRTCCEPMPDVPRDALIGRVGDHIFLVGDKSKLEVQESGELQLRVNDCDEGLFDNSGSLTVQISP
jgi:hypothetical protein